MELSTGRPYSKLIASIPFFPREETKANIELIEGQKRVRIKSPIEMEFLNRQAKPKGGKKKKAAKGKRLWEKYEDEAVEQLVKKHGIKKWSLIAEKLDTEYKIKGRNGKQCRERWHNHLNPFVKKLPLSDGEEKLIFEKHREYGNKWAEIAKYLNGRTDNVIKNYFYATLRRQFRKITKKMKGKSYPPPKEITLQYINRIMMENNLSYDDLDNKNVREELKLMNKEPNITEKQLPSMAHNYTL